MTIARHRKGRAWVYDDPVEADAAFVFVSLFGFDLSLFDDWLEAPGWKAGELPDVLELRQRAIDAYRSGNMDAAEAWCMLLDFTHETNLREAFLHPLALIGKQVRHRLPKPGERKTIYTPKRSAVTISSRDKRVLEASSRGESVATIAAREPIPISLRTVQRIRAKHRTP